VRSPIYFNKLKTYFNQILLQHPDTLIKEAQWLVPKTEPNKEMFKFTVWYLTYTSETSTIMGIDAFFVFMVENYYMTGKAYWITDAVLEKISGRAKTLKPILLGQIAPDMRMTDSNLVITPLHQVKSPYTIIYFWDYNCGHCKKESPILLDYYDKNKDLVSVYAVGMIEDFEKWKSYIREHNFDWINVVDARNWTNFRKLYDLNSTPIIYLLDENKKILAKKISADQTIDFIERLKKDAVE
jgi:thiol-disulfide isomerase/thioredoxin